MNFLEAIRIRRYLFLPVLLGCCLSAGVTAHGLDVADPLMPAPQSGTNRAYSCIFHVHSKLSYYGRYSLPEMTAVATNYGVDAIILTDNLTDTIQYGLPGFRNLAWLNYSHPSIVTVGAARYLEMIAEENRRQTQVLYIPGVEVCPRFYWMGSLLETNLVCYGHQKNLIVFGIHDPSVIRRLPEACGFVRGKNTGWMVFSRITMGLLILAILGIFSVPRWLAHSSSFSVQTLRKSYIVGFLLPFFLVLAGLNWAFGKLPSMQIYEPDAAAGHDQRSVDFVKKAGGLCYWAHPEAVDYNEFKYAGVSFKAVTDPHPWILKKTTGYDGFGGVYEDSVTVINPGGAWDEVLGEYTRGARTNPVWCFGEMLYHFEGQAGKKMGNVETMVWAKERTESALLESVRQGRFYARQNSAGQSLSLDEWWLRVEERGIHVVGAVSSSRPGEPVHVMLIKDGSIIREFKGQTPCRLDIGDRPPDAGTRASYRFMVVGKYPLVLVSNPLFPEWK